MTDFSSTHVDLSTRFFKRSLCITKINGCLALELVTLRVAKSLPRVVLGTLDTKTERLSRPHERPR